MRISAKCFYGNHGNLYKIPQMRYFLFSDAALILRLNKGVNYEKNKPIFSNAMHRVFV